MKKSLLLTLLLVTTIKITGFACTTFFINKNGRMVFGRNYDWVSGNGMIHTNLSGLNKTSFIMQDGATISWTSKYGSITFNQYGKEFPNGGMNEKGLVVELMWLNQTRFEAIDSRPAVNVLQWIQFQLDNCSSVAEVIATGQKIRVSSGGSIPLHYLVADASGKTASIEFINGQAVIHSGKDLPFAVLTNNTYKQSTEYVRSLGQTRPQEEQGFQRNSLDRFATVCSMVSDYSKQDFKQPVTDHAFIILDKVAQGEFTKWSIVYDITDKKIHFKTQQSPTKKTIDLKSFALSCQAIPSMSDMNQTLNEFRFISYSHELNKKSVHTSFLESREKVNLPQELVNQLVLYPDTISCQ